MPRPPDRVFSSSVPERSTIPAHVSQRDSDVDLEEKTILDLVDNLLNQGVVINGELILGVAGVDLVYLRLSALLAAADRVLPRLPPASK